jgi:hypothetical protein
MTTVSAFGRKGVDKTATCYLASADYFCVLAFEPCTYARKYNNLPGYRNAKYTCSTRFVPARGEQHTQSVTFEDGDGFLTDNAANYRIAY